MIEKEGYWLLLERKRGKGFLHRIVTGDKKWVRYNDPNPNPSAEDHEDCPVVILLRRHLGRMNIHGSKVTRLLSYVAPSADFHLTHLAQWHTAWLSSTSARVKK
nr:hypothetical transcript [Hymenolepis microstoma]